MQVKTRAIALFLTSAAFSAVMAAPANAQATPNDRRAAAAANSTTTMPVTIPAGTPILVALDSDVSSASVNQGDKLSFHLVSDYSEFGHVLIPAGTHVRGSVSKVNRRSAGGKPGTVTVSVDAVRAIDGTRIPLRGTKAAVGKNRQGQASLLGVLTLGVGATKKGLSAVIASGTEFTVFTDATKTIVVAR
jgi:hypothetical protein